MTVTLLSLGLPMILMGDEIRRTQHGNNNAYCHDNEGNWFDWSLLEKHADIHRFVKLLIGRRLLRDSGPGCQRMNLMQLIGKAIRGWLEVKLNQSDWSDHSRSVALSAELQNEGLRVHFIFNAYWEPLDFDLPPIGTAKPSSWRRWIDTSGTARGHRCMARRTHVSNWAAICGRSLVENWRRSVARRVRQIVWPQ
jgi:isoamylase